MALHIRSIRGMHDIVPDMASCWQFVEAKIKQILASYGYQEIRLPIIEKSALFSRSIGEITDIVEKEMYTFDDRNGDKLALRPEGTAGCARAVMQHGMIDKVQRLWYMGPMFRYERPQKGRYRQFHQLGVEVYGLTAPDIDVELMLMTARLWQALGLTDITLQINSLGSTEARLAYRDKLLAYFKAHDDDLDEDSKRRLHTNPLRILDSKHPDMQALNAKAPKLIDHLDDRSRQEFKVLCQRLDELDVAYQINPRLVRGLDYYGKTVFEWVTDKLGAQSAVCAGGRYDDLMTELGGKSLAAIGFAIGIERLIALMTENEDSYQSSAADVCIVAVGELATSRAVVIAEQIRDQFPNLKLMGYGGGSSFKSQFKHADRSGVRWVLILGEDEIKKQVVSVKKMATGEQEAVPLNNLMNYLKNITL